MQQIVGLVPLQLFEMAFTLALVAAALLLLGGFLSFVVFGYKSLRGEGMKDPRESDVVAAQEESDGVQRGDADDEWKYY